MKLIVNLIIVITFFFIGSYLWPFINIQYKNPENVVGILTLSKYNPNTDTLRFVFLILLTTTAFFLTRYLQEKKILKLKEYFLVNNFHKLNSFKIKKNRIFFLLIVYIIIEFFSSNHFVYFYDALHDGDNLTPALNFSISKEFWKSTLPIHGLSNLLYGNFGWELFGFQTIGSLRYFYILLLFLVKLSVIFFAYEITKIFNFKEKEKNLIFIYLSLILINFISYEIPINYSIISYRDLFGVIYLIFLINFFSNNFFNTKILLILSLISNCSILFHYDIGTYLNFLNLLLLVYFFLGKKYKLILYLVFYYIVFWLIALFYIGIEEINLFLNHYIFMVLNIDYVHGIKFPQPFFDIGINSDGSRATKSLVILIMSLCLVIETIFFTKKNFFYINSKIILVIFSILSLIMFKNALGRSDSYHIKMSSEYPLLLISIFFILYFLNSSLFKKYKTILTNKFLHYFVIIFFIIFKFNYTNFVNYKFSLLSYLKAPDELFLDNNTKEFISYSHKVFKNENCIFNFTMDLGLPYLLKKPNCTKYFQTYTNSGYSIEQRYIQELKKINHKYLIYQSPNFDVDNIKIKKRLKYVNRYILDNYILFNEQNDFQIYIKKTN